MFNNFGGGGGMPSLRRNASENRPAPPTYTINLRAYPALYIAREDLELGNKSNIFQMIISNSFTPFFNSSQFMYLKLFFSNS